MELFHLGIPLNIIMPFFASSQSAQLLIVPPSLSPNDSKFAEWFQKYEVMMKKTDLSKDPRYSEWFKKYKQ